MTSQEIDLGQEVDQEEDQEMADDELEDGENPETET